MKAKVQMLPRLTELEDFRRSTNRKIWAVIVLLGVVTIGSLFLALIAFARPIPVVAFDEKGHPLLFADTVTPRVKLENIRVEAFARTFLERWSLVDSGNVADDFTASLNMMTPRYRRIVMNDTDEVERRKKRSSFNMKSRFVSFETKVSAYDADDVNAKVYAVAWGKMRFVPKVEGAVQDEEAFKYYFSELAIQRVPVTKDSIHGLLVDYAYTRLFDTEEDMNVYALKRQ
jgi:hypothetical protein